VPPALRSARPRWVTPPVALAVDRPKELAGLSPPGVPSLEDVLCIGGQNALAGLAAPVALGEGRCPQISDHRPTPHAELLGHRTRRPALAVPRPDLVVGGKPSRPALGRPCLCLQRRRARRPQYGGRAVGLDHGRTPQRVTHGFAPLPMGAEALSPGCGEVLHKVQPVGPPGGRRSARPRALALRFHASAGDDGDPRMRL
jgi:hypothetical protein